MAAPIYFISGTTGFLGGELLNTILAEDANAQCYCLVRDVLQCKIDLSSGRVFLVKGDITLDHLGLNIDEYQDLAKKITHVIHSAAMVQFEKPKAVLELVNVQGTRNMIAFAKACQQHNPEFKMLAYVSTAYVAGQRKGLVSEQDFSDASGFKNNYEATKFAAESLLREVKSTLPIIIFRPSIILGHSQTGRTLRSNVLFPLTQLIKKYPFSIGIIPANKHCLLDLVPVDYVARSICYLINTPAAVGQVFHLTSGQGNELTVLQAMAVFREVYHKQIFIAPSGFWPIVRKFLSYSKQGRYFITGADPFWLYTVANPQFNAKATQKLLDQFAIRCDPMKDVLKKTLQFMER